MTPHEVRKYLVDIAQAADQLSEFIADKTFEGYVADSMLRSAVERQFEIIGEALNQAIRADPELRNRISDTGRIIAFRNRLIHGYASVADELVWGVCESSLPRLRSEVGELLEAAEGED